MMAWSRRLRARSSMCSISRTSSIRLCQTFQRRQLGERAHAGTVRRNRGRRGGAGPLVGKLRVQCGHCDARRQPLEVDGEIDPGQRLVEIIDVEENELLRGVEGAEVHEMAVAAGL